MASFTTSGGVRLHHRLSGKGSPALVFIHGWCSNLRHWDAQARAFGRRHRVLRMDRPGFGRSSGGERPHSWREQADMIAELMRSARMRGAVVIGHAGGSGTALELTARHAERVRALVLLDGAPVQAMSPQAARDHPFVRNFEGRYAETLRAEYASYFSDLTDRKQVRAVVDEAVSTPEEVAIRELVQILSTDTTEAARRIEQPMLCVAAESARLRHDQLRETIPHARFGRTIGTEHFLQIDAPGQVNAMIERFLASL